MDILLLNTAAGLVPLYDDGYEEKRKLKLGQTYRARIVKARNPEFHRKYFALINAAWACLPEQAQAKLKTPENFRKYAEVAAGHCETIYHPRLREFVEIPKSIAFDSMDGAAFEDMYGRVRAVIDSLLGPVLSPEEFDRILLNF